MRCNFIWASGYCTSLVIKLKLVSKPHPTPIYGVAPNWDSQLSQLLKAHHEFSQKCTLKLDESEKAVVSLSPYIALLATSDRAIGFDAATGRVIETQLPIRDELLAVRAERYIVVVITSSRAFGLTTEPWSFKEITFRTNEKVEKIKLTYSKATVQTSDRLLTFEASDSTWKEHRLY